MLSYKMKAHVTRTTRAMGMAAVCILTGTALVLAAAVPASWADDGEGEIPFSRVNVFIEFNATDQDVGIQVLLDGEPWKEVKMFAPDGSVILDIEAARSLQDQGLSELFFESSEPSLDEVSLDEFLRRFPEGEYEFEGKTIDGIEIDGETRLSHVIPAGPDIISPYEGQVVDPDNFVIEWEPVTESITDSQEPDIVGYEVIVEQTNPLRVLSVKLPASATRVTVPPEFFVQRGTVHKFEILAIEASGNQTITSSEFVTQR